MRVVCVCVVCGVNVCDVVLYVLRVRVACVVCAALRKFMSLKQMVWHSAHSREKVTWALFGQSLACQTLQSNMWTTGCCGVRPRRRARTCMLMRVYGERFGVAYL